MEDFHFLMILVSSGHFSAQGLPSPSSLAHTFLLSAGDAARASALPVCLLGSISRDEGSVSQKRHMFTASSVFSRKIKGVLFH